jgi:hypothetical protein
MGEDLRIVGTQLLGFQVAEALKIHFLKIHLLFDA